MRSPCAGRSWLQFDSIEEGLSATRSLESLAWTSCSLDFVSRSLILPLLELASRKLRMSVTTENASQSITMIWVSSTHPCQLWLKMNLGCRAQPKMHLMTNSIQLKLISKRQVNLKIHYCKYKSTWSSNLTTKIFASYNWISNAPWCVEFKYFDLSIVDVVNDLNVWEITS